ncbi:unnamed protein product [Bursaphelenchus xylophilus]|uniref:(pine wood nematode) hypothetical protein n=1 Tax=Bursaphelenchus xylophilus TaxID=6326 RepID=A0A1I7S6S4_BURXY|nr:unnamed protein product [Bursaphelenchus xylophilus]CAG9079837.1 unnamed protein product [Bursaphelenchus xylophilus]
MARGPGRDFRPEEVGPAPVLSNFSARPGPLLVRFVMASDGQIPFLDLAFSCQILLYLIVLRALARPQIFPPFQIAQSYKVKMLSKKEMSSHIIS